ncbi:NAD(P)-binding protein [Periconia macrospinosa]|uniref:NAD(P)-binding protein n=1 Tax=Periconia macrospinosa TaxID=97972 RepID=A0A2V1E4I8_9PLEO|nr:NAD(P)-binding protein [Periconia macrospinosa]
MGALKKVFIVGPGYIGWNVLELLVAENYTVSGLVRRKEHAEGIENSGGIAVYGDINDHDLIVRNVLENDIVIHTASADHLPSVEAVLDGIKQRTAANLSTIFIHTSGSNVVGDSSYGATETSKVYTDSTPDEIDTLSDSAFHRKIDLAIIRASKELDDKAKLAIMIPTEIYGLNKSHKRQSIRIPTITRFALTHGFAGYVGKGLAVESQIHVMDLARAYIVLLHHMERSSAVEFVQNPYFFCENGKEFSWKEAAEQVGKALKERALIKDETPREFSREDWEELFGEYTGLIMGSNCRCRAARLKELGWEAKEMGIWESFVQEGLPEILKEENTARVGLW